MGKPKPPAPPDPRETSAAQTGTNVSTTLANNVMGMVNQTTPYGSLTYNQTDDYSWTDPYTNETYTVPRYEAVTQLSPEQQAILDTNQQTQGNLSNIAADRSSFLQDYLSQDPTTGMGELNDYLYDMGRERIDPRFAQRREGLQAQLANQGIAPGSEAYNREMALLGQDENDAYNQLMLSGRGQAMNEITAQRNQPINEIIGLLSGTQVQQPGVSMNQPGRMPYTDNAGLINENYGQRVNNYNTQMAQRQNLLGGLFGLAGGFF